MYVTFVTPAHFVTAGGVEVEIEVVYVVNTTVEAGNVLVVVIVAEEAVSVMVTVGSSGPRLAIWAFRRTLKGIPLAFAYIISRTCRGLDLEDEGGMMVVCGRYNGCWSFGSTPGG